jgi:uncharacterized coiled-coil DUF342 family protein
MAEVMKALNGVLDVIKRELDNFVKASKELEAKREKLEAQDKELVERAKDLLAREARIKPIENVVELKDKANQLKREADETLHLSRKERDEFNKSSKRIKDELETEIHKIANDRKKCDSEMAMIHKEWEVLRAEQKTWKANFIAELQRKAG